jgi:hypothetical protein
MLTLCRWSSLLLLLGGCAREAKGGPEREEGRAARPGAEGRLAPISEINTWLDGLHVLKYDPDHVMEVNHFCARVNADLMQCSLYDHNAPNARLVGIEYVISERAFDELPQREKSMWHPHNYEVLSGMLVAPGVGPKKDRAVAEELLNTYGKTWQTWDTGAPGFHSDRMPLGDPQLAWSLNADNEAPKKLVEAREQRLDVDTAKLRRNRAILTRDAHPQMGVNALAPHFPNRRLIQGVEESGPRAPSRSESR